MINPRSQTFPWRSLWQPKKPFTPRLPKVSRLEKSSLPEDDHASPAGCPLRKPGLVSLDRSPRSASTPVCSTSLPNSQVPAAHAGILTHQFFPSTAGNIDGSYFFPLDSSVLTGGSDVESRKISVTGCCGSLAGCPGAGRGRVSATVAADRARAGSCT